VEEVPGDNKVLGVTGDQVHHLLLVLLPWEDMIITREDLLLLLGSGVLAAQG